MNNETIYCGCLESLYFIYYLSVYMKLYNIIYSLYPYGLYNQLVIDPQYFILNT